MIWKRVFLMTRDIESTADLSRASKMPMRGLHWPTRFGRVCANWLLGSRNNAAGYRAFLLSAFTVAALSPCPIAITLWICLAMLATSIPASAICLVRES